MRLLRSVLVLACAGLSVAGCSQPRPKPILGCNYQVIPLTVGPNWSEKAAAVDLPAYELETDPAKRLGAVLRERRARRKAAVTPLPPSGGSVNGVQTVPELQAVSGPDQFLALSGGGQHGAFGAGFFYGMAEGKTLPTWDIVTGVSTGSLQSTLLFLANQPVPADRTDYGWVGGPLSGKEGDTGFVVKPGTSNVGDLVLAYSILKEADLLRVRMGGAGLGIVFKGSSASFAPLRARLLKIMTVGTLRAVGEEWKQRQRQLFVGVSNLDEGGGYAIDMTELAARTLATSAPGELARIQGCYVDALLASSSVPPGVPPVTLQTGDSIAMYMDGGARFGMFLEPVLRAIKAADGGNSKADQDAQIMLMVNTSMQAGSWSGDGAPKQRWTAVDAALRAVDLLETQVYSFSAAQVEQLGLQNRWLRMASLTAAPKGEQPDDHHFYGKTCSEWQAIDAKAKPLQFYPWYMACTADYGRARGLVEQWNKRFPPS